jgi:hypothetical protein
MARLAEVDEEVQEGGVDAEVEWLWIENHGCGVEKRTAVCSSATNWMIPFLMSGGAKKSFFA